MMFISVDGGATKTVAVCYSEDGIILGMGISGSGNYRTAGVEKAGKNIREAILRAVHRADVDESEITKFSIALAGVKDSNLKNELVSSIVDKERASKVRVLNDGEVGFECRFPGMDGIVICPGTGMVSYGRKGNIFKRVSGWGWILGDEGGAFYIAKRALQETMKIYDGRSGIRSDIPDYVKDYFQINDLKEIVNKVYTNPPEIGRIASFASIVSKLAEKEDDLATLLMEESAAEAARCITSLTESMFGEEKVHFSGYGGLFRASNIYWDKIRKIVLDQHPDMIPSEPLYGYHAVIGSIYLMLKEENMDLKFDLDSEVKSIDNQISRISEYERDRYLLMH